MEVAPPQPSTQSFFTTANTEHPGLGRNGCTPQGIVDHTAFVDGIRGSARFASGLRLEGGTD